jgi:hypothetical protein
MDGEGQPAPELEKEQQEAPAVVAKGGDDE